MDPIQQPDAFAAQPQGSPTALAELLAAFPKGELSARRARVQGLVGASRGFVLTQLSLTSRRPLVCVTRDEETADALEKDLRFFSGTPADGESAPRVLRIPGDEVLPYEGLTPDRLVALGRLAGLFHLHLDAQSAQAPRAIVVSVRALSRKVLPRAELDTRSLQLSREMELDRDELARRLTAAGYVKAPLVEDPGSFAVRGGVFDVWSPLSDKPVRLEFLGDLIETIRSFDPQTQRSLLDLSELSLCPAREIVLDESGKKRAIAAVRHAADLHDVPTRTLRDRINELQAAGQDDALLAASLAPLLPAFFENGLDALTAYLPKDALFVLDDPLELERQWSDLWRELSAAFDASKAKGKLTLPPEQHFLHERDLRAAMEKTGLVELSQLALGRGAGTTDLLEQLEDLAAEPEIARGTVEVSFAHGETASLRGEVQGHHGESGALEPFVRRLQSFRDRGLAVYLACHSTAAAERVKRLLLDRSLMAQLGETPDPLLLRKSSDAAGAAAPGAYGGVVFDAHVHAHLVVAEISRGFTDPAARLAVFSDEDLFGPRALARKAARRPKTFGVEGADFRDLQEGDLVVHIDHGIARYDGLVRLNVRGIAADFILLQFAGKDRLYLPVGRLRQIQKYSGGNPETARLDSLKSQTFQKRKARVKEELLKMAAELLDLYAARAAHEGHAFHPPDDLYLQFEGDFEFEETPDQAKAIDDVLADMQKVKPMDRLVCGDVGYGKTEVALRAAFKAVEDKKQVAILVPTTVLAAQHFRTFTKRFADYPISVEMVSRFRDAIATKDILTRAREGRVDVLIGTHRLLSSDVSFKDLGLLVIDEEQRFGVKHKEQIKKLKVLVDVLTLSATPIPRTLNMAMMGVRDLSLITTAPVDRRAIRTFVCKFEAHTIKEAIERELSRGGQVFFLHNRIQSILGVRDYLAKLVPQAKIAVAHGQMAEGKLEEVMTEFVDKQHDVLLCTAIIESGLDIPSANTILIDRADTFGLAQLYQIRGRVGRSRERAYAYLLVPARRPMTRDAQKRLQVLQQFTELGAGFQIASHDLEMRGAGNLLGPDQSGTIEAVGFDLYTQLLEEAVAELRGEPRREEFEPDVELPVLALIPETYVPEVPQRLFFYKRLAQAQSEEELYDVKGELRDTCGEAPAEVDALIEVMNLKIVLRSLAMRGLKSGPSRLVVQLGPDALLDPAKLAQLVARGKGRYRLTPGMELVEHLPGEAPVPGERAREVPAHTLLESARRLLQELSGCAL